MLNAPNAVENQKVSICRLSGENKRMITLAMKMAENQAALKGSPIELVDTLKSLANQLESSKEIWLIES